MNLLRKSLAEFAGTFALVFIGCGCIMISERFPGSISPEMVPVAFGLAVLIMVYAVGHISGAHFNPAVTLAFAVARHFPIREVWAYFCAQILGALFAMFLLKTLLPHGNTFGATIPAVSALQALGLEVVLAFILMFVIISVATDTRAVGVMAGVAIGAAVTVLALVGGPLTGASMNPARSLAPALFQHEMKYLWIYVMGPVLGAVLGALFYEFMRCDKSENKNSMGCC